LVELEFQGKFKRVC